MIELFSNGRKTIAVTEDAVYIGNGSLHSGLGKMTKYDIQERWGVKDGKGTEMLDCGDIRVYVYKDGKLEWGKLKFDSVDVDAKISDKKPYRIIVEK